MAQEQLPGMTDKYETENEVNAPLPPSVVFLKAAVYLMGIILVAGFAFVVYALVTRANKPLEAVVDDKPSTAAILLQPGETISSVSLEGKMLVLHLTSAEGGDAIMIYDVNKNHVIRRISVARNPAN
jgi:hypothetical protein